MNSCNNCQYDDRVDTIYCKQGHYRSEAGIIKDCHAWQGKEECECYKYSASTDFMEHFNIVCKKCGRIIE